MALVSQHDSRIRTKFSNWIGRSRHSQHSQIPFRPNELIAWACILWAATISLNLSSRAATLSRSCDHKTIMQQSRCFDARAVAVDVDVVAVFVEFSDFSYLELSKRNFYWTPHSKGYTLSSISCQWNSNVPIIFQRCSIIASLLGRNLLRLFFSQCCCCCCCCCIILFKIIHNIHATANKFAAANHKFY